MRTPRRAVPNPSTLHSLIRRSFRDFLPDFDRRGRGGGGGIQHMQHPIFRDKQKIVHQLPRIGNRLRPYARRARHQVVRLNLGDQPLQASRERGL